MLRMGTVTNRTKAIQGGAVQAGGIAVRTAAGGTLFQRKADFATERPGDCP